MESPKTGGLSARSPPLYRPSHDRVRVASADLHHVLKLTPLVPVTPNTGRADLPPITARENLDGLGGEGDAHEGDNPLELGPGALLSRLSKSWTSGMSSSSEGPAAPEASGAGQAGLNPFTQRFYWWCERINRVLNHSVTTTIVSLATLYVLFFNDIRLLAFSKDADFAFEVLSAICLAVFVLEMLARLMTETWLSDPPTPLSEEAARNMGFFARLRRCRRLEGYAFSLMFWLDLLAIASLFPEIDWIWGAFVVGQSSAVGNFETARASRVARAGSRLGRILRMVRVSRVFKMICQARHTGLATSLLAPWQTWGRYAKPPAGALGSVRESQMGYKLSEATTRTVIILILLLILLVPVFVYDSGDTGPEIAAQTLHSFNAWRSSGWTEAVWATRSQFYRWTQGDGVLSADVGAHKLVYLHIEPALENNELDYAVPDVISQLRTSASGEEMTTFTYEGPAVWDPSVIVKTVISFNLRPAVRVNSAFSLLLTLFVILLLLFGALQFTADAQKLVLRPIENMIAFVERTALDPMGTSDISSKDNTGTYETKVLENTIKKITGILRVGFGSAGMLTVARHLDSSKKSIGANQVDGKVVPNTNEAAPPSPSIAGATIAARTLVDAELAKAAAGVSIDPSANSLFEPFRKGRFVRAVFLRVQIPAFDTICRILGPEAVAYSNKVAKIVHDTVLSWGGTPIANTGHGYLCVWIIDDAWESRITDAAILQQVQAGTDGFYLGGTGLELGAKIGDEHDDDDTNHWKSPPAGLRKRRHERRSSLGAVITGIDLGSGGQGRNRRSFARATQAVKADMRRADSPMGVAATPVASSPSPEKEPNSAKPSPPPVHGMPPSIHSELGEVSRRKSAPFIAQPAASRPAGGGFDVHSNPLLISPGTPAVQEPTTRRREGDPPVSLVVSRRNSLQLPDREARALLLETASELADKALVACVKTIAAIQRSQEIYMGSEQKKLRDSSELHGHRLWLEFGLHVGWAIEGAVGTNHKVDATYISSHVETTVSLQRLCRVYGSQILFSSAFFRLLSPSVRLLCRRVDSISFEEPYATAGEGRPMSIYTLDTFDWGISIPQPNIRKDILKSIVNGPSTLPGDRVPTAARRTPRPASFAAADTDTPSAYLLAQRPVGLPSFSALGASKQVDADLFNVRRSGMSDRERCISILGEADIIDHPIVYREYNRNLFSEDPELIALRTPYSDQFVRLHTRAVEAYIQGKWDLSKMLFEQLPAALFDGLATTGGPETSDQLDEPSKAVFTYMASFGFVAPAWWRGRRPRPA